MRARYTNSSGNFFPFVPTSVPPDTRTLFPNSDHNRTHSFLESGNEIPPLLLSSSSPIYTSSEFFLGGEELHRCTAEWAGRGRERGIEKKNYSPPPPHWQPSPFSPYTFITLPLPVTHSARVLHCVPDEVCFWKGFWYTAVFFLFHFRSHLRPVSCPDLPKFWNARNFFKYV